MPKIILLVSLCLLMTFPIKAQDYQLREPSLEDYLHIASEALGGCGWEPRQSYPPKPWDLCAYLLDKIEKSGEDTLENYPYDLLKGAFDGLQPASDWITPGDPYLWQEALLFSWLRDHPIDLDKQSEFTADDMDIQVQPHDFNADGVNEYVLEVSGSRLSSYFVVTQEADGTHKKISTFLPYSDSAAPYFDHFANELHEVAFKDFNGDGLPEWFIAYDGASYRGDYIGEIDLMGWQDGKIKSLMKEPIHYIPYFQTNANNLRDHSIQDGHVFRNLDDDPALELQAIEVTSDNWGCPQTNTRIYDWDKTVSLYTEVSNNVHRPNKANCVMEDAENALYNQDYSAAAHLYEYARTLPLQDGNQVELPQYIQLRLVQAYLLNREYEAANKLLDILARRSMNSTMLYQLRQELISHRQAEPDETCSALYNLFERAIRYAFNYGGFQEAIGTKLVIGMRWKFNGDFIGAGNPADPAFAGCNVPRTIDAYLDRGIYNFQGSPQNSLRGSEYKVSDSLQADFNGDGQNDWLLWFDAHVPAVLLLSQGENKPYLVSRAAIPHRNNLVTITTVPLPDHAGAALVAFQAKGDLPAYFGGFDCGTSASVLGAVQMWQYGKNGLTVTQSTSWCDDYRTVNQLFRKVDGKSVFYMRDQGKVAAYFWNPDTKRYQLPTPAGVNSTSVAATQHEPSNEELYMMNDVNNDYFLRLDDQVQAATRVEDAVAILDAEIKAKYMQYPAPLEFWKAILLQTARRDHQALAQFVALYEAEPESVWGKMAALHFETLKKN